MQSSPRNVIALGGSADSIFPTRLDWPRSLSLANGLDGHFPGGSFASSNDGCATNKILMNECEF